ncbi:hypothetical protein ACTXT7_010663 [Hymenolepis weldensis]
MSVTTQNNPLKGCVKIKISASYCLLGCPQNHATNRESCNVKILNHPTLLDFQLQSIQSSELHRVATCPPHHHREGSPIASSSTSHSFSTSSQPITRNDNCSSQSKWYSSLVELLIDDLIEYAKEFPLQIRWIYSELQKCPELKSTNAVWCNLLFLRGICPSICTGSCGSAPESPVRDSKTLTTVAKSLIALTSQKRSDNALPPEVFESCRSKLINKFAPHVLSPLSSEELNRLEGLYIEEAMRASANSMSRELAQLASYFQLVFLPDNSNASLGDDCVGMSNARTLLNNTQLTEHQRPNVPHLQESLLELSHFAPSTFHHHPLHAESSSTSTSTSKPSGGGGGVGLMRGLGGIFSSPSSSNPSSFS